MYLSVNDLAGMIDLSCVCTTSSKAFIEDMVEEARKYGFGQVSVLQCFIPYTRQLLSQRVYQIGDQPARGGCCGLTPAINALGVYTPRRYS